MAKRWSRYAMLLILALLMIDQMTPAQSPTAGQPASNAQDVGEFRFSNLLAQARMPRRLGFSLMPAARSVGVGGPVFNLAPMAAFASPPVLGSGILGRVPKWVGLTSSNAYIGDSSIFEDKNGLVGIGTDTPTARLTVAGQIQSTIGGFKFPDGTMQVTAGIAPTQVVKSLNGLMGDLTLQQGVNITITQSANTLTIAAANALTGITHNATLVGNGTSASPLGLATPLSLATPPTGNGLNVVGGAGGAGVSAIGGSSGAIARGSVATTSSGDGVVAVGGNPDGAGVNATGGSLGFGVKAVGGSQCEPIGPFAPTCDGVLAIGGSRNGAGVRATGFAGGGAGVIAQGGGDGIGVFSIGGNTDNFSGGSGLEARGGRATVNGTGGGGVSGTGGNSVGGRGGAGGGFVGGTGGTGGGLGVVASGGNATNPGGMGGVGLIVSAGSSNPTTNYPHSADFMGGDVHADGWRIIANQKLFRIDHPLDPENKYLNHVSIESSEVLNIYSGNVTTDASGQAVVELPDWFESLNKDFRYQLTVVGTFAQAIVAQKIKGNHFVIATNAANTEVSWQVTGVRCDPAAKKHPLVVEEDKPEFERGSYLNPEVYGQPEEKGVHWARYPQMMQQQKALRERAMQKQSQQ